MKENRSEFLENLARKEIVVSECERKFKKGSLEVSIGVYNEDMNAQAILRERMKEYTKTLRAKPFYGAHKETGTSRFLGWLQNNKEYIPELLDCLCGISDATANNIEKFVSRYNYKDYFEKLKVTTSDIIWSLGILPCSWTEGLQQAK